LESAVEVEGSLDGVGGEGFLGRVRKWWRGELVGSDEVGMGEITNVGVVEEVIVVSDLEVGLSTLVGLVETHHHLTVSLTGE
jgi:hypothetical protein